MANMLTVEEAAQLLGVTVGRVRQLLTDKRIQAVKTPTTSKYRGEWRINKDSVLQYAATRRVGRPRTR